MELKRNIPDSKLSWAMFPWCQMFVDFCYAAGGREQSEVICTPLRHIYPSGKSLHCSYAYMRHTKLTHSHKQGESGIVSHTVKQ